jgi:hypothetical protein
VASYYEQILPQRRVVRNPELDVALREKKKVSVSYGQGNQINQRCGKWEILTFVALPITSSACGSFGSMFINCFALDAMSRLSSRRPRVELSPLVWMLFLCEG